MASLIGRMVRNKDTIRTTTLTILGLGLIDMALGMWLLPVGVGAAGASLLLLEWLARE